MSKVTVTQLADVLGVDSKRLLAQLNDAGMNTRTTSRHPTPQPISHF